MCPIYGMDTLHESVSQRHLPRDLRSLTLFLWRVICFVGTFLDPFLQSCNPLRKVASFHFMR